MWLPDELAFAYSRFSPRQNFREIYREHSREAILHFQRRGRGVSFHEFDVAIKPARELKVLSSISAIRPRRSLWHRISGRISDEKRYASMLRRLAPGIHEGFFQRFLYLIIEED
jgi:S-adenosylmethionine-dependent methyltransferase